MYFFPYKLYNNTDKLPLFTIFDDGEDDQMIEFVRDNKVYQYVNPLNYINEWQDLRKSHIGRNILCEQLNCGKNRHIKNKIVDWRYCIYYDKEDLYNKKRTEVVLFKARYDCRTYYIELLNLLTDKDLIAIFNNM